MTREIKYFEAIQEATDQAMATDRDVLLMGLGVPGPTGVFGTTKGLQEKYGPDRVFDMPSSENAMTGVALGAATRGKRPIMVHRAIFGSVERFFGILVENCAGDFPLWLAPEQVRVLPLTDDQVPAGEELQAKLKGLDIRAGIESRNDKIGAKIRTAQLEKIPYMLILGARELEEGKVAVRSRVDGDLGTMTLDEFLARFNSELNETVETD